MNAASSSVQDDYAKSHVSDVLATLGHLVEVDILPVRQLCSHEDSADNTPAEVYNALAVLNTAGIAAGDFVPHGVIDNLKKDCHVAVNGVAAGLEVHHHPVATACDGSATNNYDAIQLFERKSDAMSYCDFMITAGNLYT